MQSDMRARLVEAAAMAKFAHIEGIPVDSDSVRYWFSVGPDATGEDADCYSICQDMRAEASIVLDAILAALPDVPNETLAVGYEAMFADKWNGTQAPMMDAGLRAMLSTITKEGNS